MSSRTFAMRLPVALGLVMASTLVSACDILSPERDLPEEARILLTGTSPDLLEVVTSTRFGYQVNEDGDPILVLEQAETSMVDPGPGFERSYAIAPDRGFYVRVRNPQDTGGTISLSVWIDESLEYKRENYSLANGSIEFSRLYDVSKY